MTKFKPVHLSLAAGGVTPSSPHLLVLSIDPILIKNPGHFVLFPIQDNEALAMFKKEQAAFNWTAEEINPLSLSGAL
jgi:hypothetical protein